MDACCGMPGDDCLLMAANLVSFLRPWTRDSPQQLLCCELITPQTRPATGIPAVPHVPGNEPDWHSALTS